MFWFFNEFLDHKVGLFVLVEQFEYLLCFVQIELAELQKQPDFELRQALVLLRELLYLLSVGQFLLFLRLEHQSYK